MPDSFIPDDPSQGGDFTPYTPPSQGDSFIPDDQSQGDSFTPDAPPPKPSGTPAGASNPFGSSSQPGELGKFIGQDLAGKNPSLGSLNGGIVSRIAGGLYQNTLGGRSFSGLAQAPGQAVNAGLNMAIGTALDNSRGSLADLTTKLIKLSETEQDPTKKAAYQNQIHANMQTLDAAQSEGNSLYSPVGTPKYGPNQSTGAAVGNVVGMAGNSALNAVVGHGVATKGMKPLAAIAAKGAEGGVRGLAFNTMQNLQDSKDLFENAGMMTAIGTISAGGIEGFDQLRRADLTQVASIATGTPRAKFQDVQGIGQEALDQAKAIAKEPNALPGLGKQVFDAATTLKLATMKQYEATLGDTLSGIGDPTQVLDSGKSAVAGLLAQEGINPTAEGGLDFANSAFRGNKEAQNAVTSMFDDLLDPTGVTDPQAVLRTRTALGTLQDQAYRSGDRQLGRLLGLSKDTFDQGISDSLPPEASAALNSAYQKGIDPAYKAIDAMTTDGQFDTDKANRFIQKVVRTGKFNETEVTRNLDAQLGTDFTTQIRTVGAAKALSALTPNTSGRILDIVKSIGAGVIGEATMGPAGFAIAGTAAAFTLFSPSWWASVVANTDGAVKDQIGQVLRDTVVTALDSIYKDSKR